MSRMFGCAAWADHGQKKSHRRTRPSRFFMRVLCGERVSSDTPVAGSFLGFLRFTSGLLDVVVFSAATTVGQCGHVNLRQPFREFCLLSGVLGMPGEIRVFERVGGFVVEFLVAVGVADVAPAFAAHRMILEAM